MAGQITEVSHLIVIPVPCDYYTEGFVCIRAWVTPHSCAYHGALHVGVVEGFLSLIA